MEQMTIRSYVYNANSPADYSGENEQAYLLEAEQSIKVGLNRNGDLQEMVGMRLHLLVAFLQTLSTMVLMRL